MDPPGTTKNGLPMLFELTGNYRSSLSPLGSMVSQLAQRVKTGSPLRTLQELHFGYYLWLRDLSDQA